MGGERGCSREKHRDLVTSLVRNWKFNTFSPSEKLQGRETHSLHDLMLYYGSQMKKRISKIQNFFPAFLDNFRTVKPFLSIKRKENPNPKPKGSSSAIMNLFPALWIL